MTKKTIASTLVTNMMTNAGIHSTKSDNSWDYVATLCGDVRGFMGSVTGIVMEAHGYLVSQNQFVGEAVVLVDGLLSDIEHATNEWQNNAQRHIGRTGYGHGPEENALITDIGLSYIQIHEKLIVRTSFLAPRLQEIVTALEYSTTGPVDNMVLAQLPNPTAVVTNFPPLVQGI